MSKPNKGRPRPADPFEALNETVSGFDYVKSLTQRNERLGIQTADEPGDHAAGAGDGGKLPKTAVTPQPMPRDPDGLCKPTTFMSLMTEPGVEFPWDSIYMNASRSGAEPAWLLAPDRAEFPAPSAPSRRRRSCSDLSLQVHDAAAAPARTSRRRPTAKPSWQRTSLLCRGARIGGNRAKRDGAWGSSHLLGGKL